MAEKFQIVRMKPGQQADVAAVANAAFGFGRDRTMEFLCDWPYLWNDDRADNYWLAMADGKIVACAGCYPLTVRVAGASFRSACVGQVATLPDWRGQGAMSAILRAVTAGMETQYDFTWLGGDRRRYGRFGWATGGAKLACSTNPRCLPDVADDAAFRPMGPEKDLDRLYETVSTAPYGIEYTKREFGQMLGIADVGGVFLGDSWVLYRGTGHWLRVGLANGGVEEIAAILSHLSGRVRGGENPDGRVTFEAPPDDDVLTRVALDHAASMEIQPVAMFRLCDMAGYFRRACRAVEPTLAGGGDELSLRNTDTGQAVRIVCENGKLSVDDQPGGDVREMTTTQLSELAFGMLPLDVVLPGLAPNSPLRALLRMPVYLPYGLYAM